MPPAAMAAPSQRQSCPCSLLPRAEGRRDSTARSAAQKSPAERYRPPESTSGWKSRRRTLPAGTLAAKARAPSNTSTRARACRPRQTSMLMERIRPRIRYRFQPKRQRPVPGVPGLKVLTGGPKVDKGLQTSSAPGDVSRGGAGYSLTRFDLLERLGDGRSQKARAAEGSRGPQLFCLYARWKGQKNLVHRRHGGRGMEHRGSRRAILES